MILQPHGLVKSRKNLYLYLHRPIDIKVGRISAQLDGLLPIKSYDVWLRGLARSRHKLNIICPRATKLSRVFTYNKEIPTDKVTHSFNQVVFWDHEANWIFYISICTGPIVIFTRLSKELSLRCRISKQVLVSLPISCFLKSW